MTSAAVPALCEYAHALESAPSRETPYAPMSRLVSANEQLRQLVRETRQKKEGVSISATMLRTWTAAGIQSTQETQASRLGRLEAGVADNAMLKEVRA